MPLTGILNPIAAEAQKQKGFPEGRCFTRRERIMPLAIRMLSSLSGVCSTPGSRAE